MQSVLPRTTSQSLPLAVLQKEAASAENFDSQFKKLPVDLSPADMSVLINTKGDEFEQFSFVNPYYYPSTSLSNNSLLSYF